MRVIKAWDKRAKEKSFAFFCFQSRISLKGSFNQLPVNIYYSTTL